MVSLYSCSCISFYVRRVTPTRLGQKCDPVLPNGADGEREKREITLGCGVGGEVLELDSEEIAAPCADSRGRVRRHLAHIPNDGETVGLEVVATDIRDARERLLEIVEMFGDR